MELKWDKDAKGAISQIKEKSYVDALKEYQGNLLLAGINYDKATKKHTCVIEEVYKKGGMHDVTAGNDKTRRNYISGSIGSGSER